MPHIIRKGRGGRRVGWRPSRGRSLLFGIMIALRTYGAFALVVRASHTLFPGSRSRLPGSIAGLPGLSALEAPAERINILVSASITDRERATNICLMCRASLTTQVEAIRWPSLASTRPQRLPPFLVSRAIPGRGAGRAWRLDDRPNQRGVPHR